MKITLDGQPKSTSHIYLYHCNFGRACGYMSAEGKRLKEDYQRQARSQFQGELLTSPLRMALTVYHGTRRKADIDNYNKLILDALSGVVYEDDSQIEELTICKAYDKARPRVELTVEVLSS